MATRVAAFRHLYDPDYVGSLRASDLYDLVLWATGDREAAAEAESCRARRREEVGLPP